MPSPARPFFYRSHLLRHQHFVVAVEDLDGHLAGFRLGDHRLIVVSRADRATSSIPPLKARLRFSYRRSPLVKEACRPRKLWRLLSVSRDQQAMSHVRDEPISSVVRSYTSPPGMVRWSRLTVDRGNGSALRLLVDAMASSRSASSTFPSQGSPPLPAPRGSDIPAGLPTPSGSSPRPGFLLPRPGIAEKGPWRSSIALWRCSMVSTRPCFASGRLAPRLLRSPGGGSRGRRPPVRRSPRPAPLPWRAYRPVAVAPRVENGEAARRECSSTCPGGRPFRQACWTTTWQSVSCAAKRSAPRISAVCGPAVAPSAGWPGHATRRGVS